MTMKPAWLIAFVLAAITLASPCASACSSVSFPPLAFPDEPDFVAFSGTVIDYTEPAFDVLGVARPRGLLVRLGGVLVPPHGKTDIEVYPLGTRPDCRPVARTQEDIQEQYAIGATITVVGKELAERRHGGMTAVVTQADDFGHVARRPDSVPQTPEGYLDFHAYRRQYEIDSSTGFSSAIAWRNAQRGWFEDYEYLRCLKALRSAAEPAKRSLLSAMAWYSRFKTDREGYRQLVGGSGLPRKTRRALLREFDTGHRPAR